MAWLSLSIRTDCQHAERLADALLAAGALAASIEDADAGTADEQPQFGEPGSISRPGWERSLVIALLRPDSDVRQLLRQCSAEAGLAEPPPFTQEEVAEQDWVRLTQSQFEPIRVSQRLWIVPSWHTAPDPEADGAYRSMRMALRSAGMQPADVGYINAHGTSTQLNDRLETKAIKRAFGEHAAHIPISSTKSMIGHTLGAAGAIEALICILAMRDGILPPTINLENPDPDCDLDYIPNVARKTPVDVTLSNSFGFGGHNVSVIFKAVE